jgi:hypothetical protein
MRERCRVKQISNPLGSTKRGQRRKARLTIAKSRLVVRTTALEMGLRQLTSNSSRRRSRKQRDRMPLWNRQQQIPDQICEVVSENTEVHFTGRTYQQSPDQESRRQSETKRHNAIVESAAPDSPPDMWSWRKHRSPLHKAHPQSLGPESRAFCKTKRHNGIVKSTTTEPVKSSARTTDSNSQAIPTSSHSARSRRRPARHSDTMPL